jgi:hypothetical protein
MSVSEEDGDSEEEEEEAEAGGEEEEEEEDEEEEEEHEEEDEEEEEEEDEEEEEEEEVAVAAKGGAKRPASTQEPPAKKSKGSDGKAAPAAAKTVTKPAVGTPQGKDTTPVKAPDHSADFIPSPSFSGSKPGMVFKKDSKGLGYYKDVKPKTGAPAARVSGQANKVSADEWASKKVHGFRV